MREVLLAALIQTGCDAIFDLEPVAASDAGSSDARPACEPHDLSGWSASNVGYGGPGDLNYPAAIGNESFYVSGAGVWGSPQRSASFAAQLAAFDGATDNTSLAVSSDGRTMWITREDAGARSVWRSTRASLGTASWTLPEQLMIETDVNPIAASAVVARDALRIVLGENARLVELVSADGVQWTSASTIGWSTTGAPYRDTDPALSADGCTLVFASTRAAPGTNDWDLWIAQRGVDGTFLFPERLDKLSTMTAEEYAPFLVTSTELWFVRRDTAGPIVMSATQ